MIDQTLEQLRALARGGEHDRAREVLAGLDTQPLRGAPHIHLSLAELAEEVGDLSRAVLEYNLSLRDDLGQPDVVLRLAGLLADQGELTRAERALRHLLELDPQHAEARSSLAELMAMQGADAAASVLRDETPGLATDVEPRAPTDSDAVCLSELFSGREGVYARQWRSRSGGTGYTPIQAPFTPAVARRHLSGAETVGIYPVRMDDTVLFAAFDLDIPKGLLARCAASGGSARRQGLEDLLAGVRGVAVALREAAGAAGLEGLLEDSGWKGCHVWFFFRHPIPAAAARRLLHGVASTVGPLPRGVQLEVFPKQARVAPGSLGNLIKLPLGVHRVTGRRCALIDETGRPLPDQLDVLHRVHRAGREEIRTVLARQRQVPAPPPDEREVGAFVDAPPYRLEGDREWQWLQRRCEVLGEIARRARASGVLTSDERKVFTYTAGHLTEGAKVVNGVFARLLGDVPAPMKSPLRGNPMSCPKIRSRVPHVASTVQCACVFQPLLDTYPHPLLHLATLRRPQEMPLGPLQAEQLVHDLWRCRNDLARMEIQQRELEARLGQLLDDTGMTSLETRAGRVYRDDGGRVVIAVAAVGGADGGVRDGAGRDGEQAPGPADHPQGVSYPGASAGG